MSKGPRSSDSPRRGKATARVLERKTASGRGLDHSKRIGIVVQTHRRKRVGVDNRPQAMWFKQSLGTFTK